MTPQISKSRRLAVLAVATCFVAGSYRAEAQVAAAKNNTASSECCNSPARMVRGGHLGSVLFMIDPGQINRLQKVAIEQSRLHIPLLFGLDVIHGFKTIFP